MMDKAKIEALISNVESSIAELKSAMSGEGETPAEQPDGEMSGEVEMEMPMKKAKVMNEEEMEPPEIVKKFAGMK